eukprot:TRINITY_DN4348_c0_g1_i3.p1 TRINITY_DN4348_c0_g1~~TRINITY_DN4348_c0_g1_i3.p1  ORF type:complete len:189 (+),score=-10.24 TRINITY_DN4348_c0_g1_i3:1211-1777(+)
MYALFSLLNAFIQILNKLNSESKMYIKKIFLQKGKEVLRESVFLNFNFYSLILRDCQSLSRIVEVLVMVVTCNIFQMVNIWSAHSYHEFDAFLQGSFVNLKKLKKKTFQNVIKHLSIQSSIFITCYNVLSGGNFNIVDLIFMFWDISVVWILFFDVVLDIQQIIQFIMYLFDYFQFQCCIDCTFNKYY